MKQILATASAVLVTLVLVTALDEAQGQGQSSGNGNGNGGGPPAGVVPQPFPVGAVVPYAGAAGSVPDGWLLCDGAQVSRVDYDGLFTVLGTSHGHGDMSTTFHLPDYRGRFLRGVDRGEGRDPDSLGRVPMNPGGNSGDLVGSVQDDRLQSHTHQDAGHAHAASASDSAHSHGTSGHTHTGTTSPDVHSHVLSPSGSHSHSVINSSTNDFIQIRDGGGASNFILDSTDTGGAYRGHLRTTHGGNHTHSVGAAGHSHTVNVDSAAEAVLPASHSHAITVIEGVANLGDPSDSGTGAGAPRHGAESRPLNAYVNFIIRAR